MGIEALSRHCEHCVFVDNNRAALDVIHKNIEKARFSENADIFQGDALSFLSSRVEGFDIIFLDPPYNKGFLTPVIEKIFEKHLLSDDGIIVCETEVNGEIYSGGDFKCVKQAKYGKVCVSIYKYA